MSVETRKWIRRGIWAVMLASALFSRARAEEEPTEPVTPREKLKASVTLSEATRLFDDARKKPYFKQVDPAGGCVKRAHVLAHLLDTEAKVDAREIQIYSGGDMVPHAPWNQDKKFKWTSHKAVVVWVEEKGTKAPYVLDLLFEGPLPLRKWIKRLRPPVETFRHDVRELEADRIFKELPREGKCHYAILPRAMKWYPKDLDVDQKTLEKAAEKTPSLRQRRRKQDKSSAHCTDCP